MKDDPRGGSTPAGNQTAINRIYQNLVEKINILDKLNAEYKVKQEHHFLRAFMNVIEKIGNQLLLAQEAYKNVDWEVKKDTYCLELAEEIHFYRIECQQLQTILNKTKEELRNCKNGYSHIQNQLQFTRQLYEKKTQECMLLKSQIKLLKKQLKSFAKGQINVEGISLRQKKSMPLQKKEEGSIQLPSQNDSEYFSKRKIESTSIGRGKAKESLTIQSQNNLSTNRNGLTLTPLNISKKESLKGNYTFYSATKSFRKRSNIPEHRRILPQEYIPDIKT